MQLAWPQNLRSIVLAIAAALAVALAPAILEAQSGSFYSSPSASMQAPYAQEDPAPRMMEPSQVITSPWAPNGATTAQPPVFPVVPGNGVPGGYSVAYPGNGNAPIPPGGTMIVSGGQCIPYDPTLQPCTTCNPCGPGDPNAMCDETYESGIGWLEDWFTRSG
ncbi:MAG TPA: hypothetical protein VHV08_09135, partial [Pirellulales bacterium]|nr:hypothetical protein [Pirellulales bacterium]